MKFSTVVIGAGSGGLTVAIGLAALGREVALVEAKDVGGDCTNVGCIPSKTLIHAVTHPDGRDGAALLAHVQERRNHLRDEETAHVSGLAHLTLVRGWARFTAPHALDVTGSDGRTETMSADKIVIATGSRPRTIAIPGLPAWRALTNETIFELEQPPAHLAIVGAGVIAMELACAMRKLGSRVTVLARSDSLLGSSPPEASRVLHERLHELGVAVLYGTVARAYDEAGGILRVEAAGRADELHGVDYLLLALGRERNLAGLNLEAAGVRYSADEGVAVDAWGQTSVPGVFAIGDVTPSSRYTHSANAQGRRVVQRIAFPLLPAVGPAPLYPSAVFSDPEVASVGLTPQQAAGRYHPELLKTITVQLRDTDRGYTESIAHGFVQVTALRLTGRILGATIVGPRAAEMISFFTLAITEGSSLYRLYRLVYPYPTHSSAIQKVADTFMRETLPNITTELAAYARYRLARPPSPASPPTEGAAAEGHSQPAAW